jgi:signal transduction histidine kinase
MLLGSAALALLAAAILVLVLQRESAWRQEQQTTVIVRQLCEQTAMLLTKRIRDYFGAAVSDTIEGIGHPELKAFDIPRIAKYLEAGLSHMYVDRFFIWSERMAPAASEEVLFYKARAENGDRPIVGPAGEPLGALYAAPELGRAIWRQAIRLYPLKRSFAIVEERINDTPYQFMIHFIWADNSRDSFLTLIGYTVDVTKIRQRLFSDMFRSGRIAMPEAERFDLAISILDDTGRLVFGNAPPPDVPSASVPLDMLFMAASLRPWLATEAQAGPWTVAVSAPEPVSTGSSGGYWLFGAVVFLIMIGLGCAITLDRQGQRLSAMQSEFVATVSHQLKTPLALLAGAAETLGRARVTSPDKVREYAGIVHAQADRLSTLVEQAIVFSVVDGKGTGLHFEVVDMVGLVRDVVERFRSGVPRDLAIEFASENGVPFVKADPSALEQVVWNLLENAVKYGNDQNSISVSVARNNAHAVLAVCDKGQGIAPDDLPRIFDRFYRSPKNARQQRGFGLGLAYVQKVVTAHGGHISVDSKAGQGAEFRVHLPAA